MTDHAISEVIQFLQPDSRKDLKELACNIITQLTGSPTGVTALCKISKVLETIINLLNDSNATIDEAVLKSLVNISAEEDGAKSLLNLEVNIVHVMVKCICNSEYEHANLACGVLANISYPESLSDKVLFYIDKTSNTLYGIVKIFCDIDFNKKGCELHLLANVLSNVSQTEIGRKKLMKQDESHFDKLLPFVEYVGSNGRRKSIIQMVHNCCFEKDYHQWLIDDQDIISRILLPLCGPDVFTEEENDSLPCFLQYLPDDKTREADIEIRLLLLESIYKLCMTKSCREQLREQNVYLIMREYHKWEKNLKLLMVTEDIVNFLIRKEEEIDCDDVSALQVPEDMIKKFDESDLKLLEEDNKNVEEIINT